MRDFILFYIGAMIGSAIGVTAMCLFQINRTDEERLYYWSTTPDGYACKKTEKSSGKEDVDEEPEGGNQSQTE